MLAGHPEGGDGCDRLSMQGRPITMENIGKMVTEGMDKAESYLHSDRPRTALQRFADAFVAVAGFLLKVLLVIIAIICSPVLLVAAVVCLRSSWLCLPYSSAGQPPSPLSPVTSGRTYRFPATWVGDWHSVSR